MTDGIAGPLLRGRFIEDGFPLPICAMAARESKIDDSEGFRVETWLFTYVVALGGEPRLDYVSPAIEGALGYDRGALLDDPTAFSFIHPADRKRFDFFLSDPPEVGTKEYFQLRDTSGESLRGRHTFQPIFGDGEKPVALESVVSERPADWEVPYDAIVDAINEGILIVRFDGEIVYVNERMAEMIGYTPGAMVGEMLFDFMADEWAEQARRNLERRKRGVEESFDHQFLHRDGHSVWTMVATKPMSETRGFRGSLVAIRDISRRKRMEEELEGARDELERRVEDRTAKLRSANEALKREVSERRRAEQKAVAASRAKSAFLAKMSHELRTPLSAILSYAELIGEDLERVGGDDGGALDLAQLDEDLDKIRYSANHLLDLINDILDLSKVEAGKMQVQPERFELDVLLDEVEKTTMPVMEANANELTVEHVEPEELWTDRRKLKQILINLVGNAGKFTEEGDVKVAVEAAEYDGGRGVRIDIIDTGIGIEEEELEKVFEPFRQADESATREYGGTGLGLNISRRYCEMLGGTLSVESEPGVGSTFTLVLPVEIEEGRARNATTTHWEQKMESTSTEDGTEIAYRTFGVGRKDVIFVHGWMVSGAVWDPLLEALSLSEYRIAVPDLRGTGASGEADEYPLERYADDVLAVADELGAETFALVGHSMGGQIAQLVAARHPERVENLALLSPVPASGMELPDEIHELFYHSGGDLEAQRTILEQACLDLEERIAEELLEVAVEIPPDCIRASYSAWTEADFADRLGEIEAETLVVASDDPFLPVEFLEEAVVEPIDSARSVQVAGAGHYVHLERVAETKEILENFLGE